jgi:hypothetical protein
LNPVEGDLGHFVDLRVGEAEIFQHVVTGPDRRKKCCREALAPSTVDHKGGVTFAA